MLHLNKAIVLMLTGLDTRKQSISASIYCKPSITNLCYDQKTCQ